MDQENFIFCGCSEQLGDGSALTALPTKDPTWFFDGELVGLDRQTVEDTIAAALASWSKVCGLLWTKAASVQAATLRIITTRIDGPRNVLADCQLPYPGMKQLLMRLDSEQWTTALNPSGGYIGLRHVLAHEFGHGMGLHHLPYAGAPDLMNPVYRPDIYEPQPDESAIVRGMYGPPRPVPTAPPPTANAGSVTVVLNGQTYIGSLAKA